MSSEYLIDVTLNKDYPIKNIKNFLSYVWRVSKDSVYCIHPSYFRFEQTRSGGNEIGDYMRELEELLIEKGFDIELIQAWSLHQDDADYQKWFEDDIIDTECIAKALANHNAIGGRDK